MSKIVRPVLTAGTAHDDVHTLGRALAGLGFENSVSRGENPFGILDDTLITAAQSYRNAYDVPAESTIPGVPQHEAYRWVGPELWAALFTDAGNVRKHD